MRSTTLALILAAGLLAPAALAQSQINVNNSGESRAINIDGDTKTEAIIRNGKVTATINGKPVPADRIVKKGDRILIKDADGKVLMELDSPESSQFGAAARERLAEARDGLEAARREQEAARRSEEAIRRGEQAARRAEEAYRRAEERARAFMGQNFAGTAEITPPKVMMGVSLAEPEAALAEHLGIDPEEATMLIGVSDDLPAAKAGLKRYDVITAIDGKKPAGQEEFRRALRARNPGDTMTLTVISKAQTKDVTVTLEAYDAEKLGVTTFNFAPGQFNMDLGGDDESRPRRSPDGQGWIVAPSPPTPPAPPAPPPAVDGRLLERLGPDGPFVIGGSRNRELDGRLKSLEERLDKLTQLIEKLAEDKAGGR